MRKKEHPEDNIAKPKGVTSRKRLISNVILLLLLTIVVVILFLSLGELSQIGETFMEISHGDHYLWLIYAILATLGFFLLYPIPLVILGKSYGKNVSAVDSYLIGANEHFFNGVTPFAAGGQPMQMYDFAKKGMGAAASTGLVLSNFLIYLTVLNAYEVFAFFYWGDFNQALLDFSNGSGQGYGFLLAAVILGYVFNLGFVVFLYFLGLSKKLASFLVKMAKLLCKIKIVNRFLGPKIPSFEEYCINVQTVTKSMFSRKRYVVAAFLVKAVVYALYFSIPFFIIKAVGIDIGFSSLPKTGLATAFASAAVCWLPTPGGTGGIEYAFSIVLSAVAPSVPFGAAQAVSLLWRMLSFYFVLILSLACVLVFEARYNASFSKKKSPSAAGGEEESSSIGFPEHEVPDDVGNGDEIRETHSDVIE